MPNKTSQTHTLSIFQDASTRAKAKARQEQEQGRKQGKGHKEEQRDSFYHFLLDCLQINRRVFDAPLIHIILPVARVFRGQSV